MYVIEDCEIIAKSDGEVLVSTEDGTFWIQQTHVGYDGIEHVGDEGRLFVDDSWALSNRHIPVVDEAVAND